MNELEELRLDPYESSKVYKEKMKKWHDKCILQREFKEGDLVLLFNSRLQLFPGNSTLGGPGLSKLSRFFLMGRSRNEAKLLGHLR